MKEAFIDSDSTHHTSRTPRPDPPTPAGTAAPRARSRCGSWRSRPRGRCGGGSWCRLGRRVGGGWGGRCGWGWGVRFCVWILDLGDYGREGIGYLLKRSRFGSRLRPIPSSKRMLMTTFTKSPSILTWWLRTMLRTSLRTSPILMAPRAKVLLFTPRTRCCILSAKTS